MCAIFSSEYFIYSLDWNIVFRLPLGYCIIYLKNPKCMHYLHLGSLFIMPWVERDAFDCHKGIT